MPAATLYICAMAVLSTLDSCGFSQGQTELQHSAHQPHPPRLHAALIYAHFLCGFKLSIVFIK